MNEKFSAWMDGELDREAAESIIQSLHADQSCRDSWAMFHIIGDAMRGQCHSPSANTQAIFSRLAAEPTVLAPAALHQARVRKRTRVALSLAASVVTLSAVGIVAMKTQQEATVVPVNLVQNDKPRPVAELPSSPPAQPPAINVNDYLIAHRQVANPDAFQQATFKAR